MRGLVMLFGVLAANAASAGEIKLAAADGTVLHAVEYGAGANGVVLIHDKGRSAADFAWYGDRLAASGFHVVAVDLRGHGGSKPPDLLTDLDYPKMTSDVAAAVAYLKAKGATKVALVGDKLGANLAIVEAADDVSVTNVIALSAGLNVAGVTVSAAVEKYGTRPLLLVASAEDAYATRTAGLLEEKAKGEKHYEILEDAGSGVKMLNKAPSLEPVMLSWLNGTYFQKPGAKAEAGAPAVGLETQGIQTTGAKYGDAEKTPPPPPAPPVDLDDE